MFVAARGGENECHHKSRDKTGREVNGQLYPTETGGHNSPNLGLKRAYFNLKITNGSVWGCQIINPILTSDTLYIGTREVGQWLG